MNIHLDFQLNVVEINGHLQLVAEHVLSNFIGIALFWNDMATYPILKTTQGAHLVWYSHRYCPLTKLHLHL